jgi:hypothetical protein
MDHTLSRFVDGEQLRDLTSKTLKFLWLHAHLSSALYIDYKILLHTGRETGLLPEEQLEFRQPVKRRCSCGSRLETSSAACQHEPYIII